MKHPACLDLLRALILPALVLLLVHCATGEVVEPDGGDGDVDGDLDGDADGDADGDGDSPGPVCGDDLCEAGENGVSCPADCAAICGDGTCDATENEVACPADCVVRCGDGFCSSEESTASCPEDCPASCGDGLCAGDETSANCPADCSSVCGDLLCSAGEDAASCPEDCPAVCGDGTCSFGEDRVSCPADCPLSCGDGVCALPETAANCEADCPASCGDGACTHAEDAASCPGECPARCGDGACTHAESVTSCPADCAAVCGDGLCTHAEDAEGCPADCDEECGDGACTHEETAAGCPADCPADCGDDDCTHDEEASSCPEDCPASCGDGACTHEEDAVTCPGDCAAVCGDGACTHSEDPTTCLIDCPAICGDGSCSSGETASSCSADCGCLAPGACGGTAPSGCRCDPSCPASGTCCPDACSVCGACPCVVAADLTWNIGGPATLGTNATGRDDVVACGYGASQEVIYTVTPTFTGDLTVSLVNAGTNYDTMLGVREGSCGGAVLACNDDFSGLQSQVNLPVNAWTTYYIIVEGFGGSTGNFELTLHRTGTCEGLAPIQDVTSLIAAGTTVIDTSTGVSSLAGTCGGGGGPEGRAIFTAPRSDRMVLSTNFAGTTFDTRLYVRDGDCDSQALELACNDDDGQNAFGRGTNSQVEISVTAGRTYHAFVDAFTTESGPVELGLGYGGTSPVRGSMGACGYDVAPDVYRFFVFTGDDLAVHADTLSAATASDLCAYVYDVDGTSILGVFDDNVACTYPPPSYSCPQGTITDVPNTGFVTVRVNQCSNTCVDASNNEYELTITRNGSPVVLMATSDL